MRRWNTDIKKREIPSTWKAWMGILGKLHNHGTPRPQPGQVSSGLEVIVGSFDIYLIESIKSLRIPIPLLYSYWDLPIHSIFLIFLVCAFFFFSSPPPFFPSELPALFSWKDWEPVSSSGRSALARGHLVEYCFVISYPLPGVHHSPDTCGWGGHLQLKELNIWSN